MIKLVPAGCQHSAELPDRQRTALTIASKLSNAKAPSQKDFDRNLIGGRSRVVVCARKRQTKNGIAFEEWSLSGPASLRGIGFQESAGSQERLVTEEILITRFGDDTYFIPKTRGNALPVPFKLVSSAASHFVFENPTHVFPQRIKYQLLESGTLSATISDMDREKSVSFEF